MQLVHKLRLVVQLNKLLLQLSMLPEQLSMYQK
jgi:hypothetical protein